MLGNVCLQKDTISNLEEALAAQTLDNKALSGHVKKLTENNARTEIEKRVGEIRVISNLKESIADTQWNNS